jgi:hypothetical protein
MYKLYEYLRDGKICLSYLGLINDEITDKFIALSEFYLKHSTHLGKLKNKTSFLIAECFQNTIRHREKAISISGHKDYFQINAWEGGVVLSSCNLVQEKNVEDLRRKITLVNSLGPEELKLFHSEVLSSDVVSEKGGAGLGLIEMARKSGRPLKFNFNPLANNLSEFFIAMEILNPTEEAAAPKISPLLDKELEFYRTLIKRNVLLLYRGEISRDILMPVIEMLEQNLMGNAGVTASEKRKLVTIIEVLQNISKHGKPLHAGTSAGEGIPGIFSIAETPTGFVVESGNFVEQAEAEHLRKSLEALKKMSKEELKAVFKKRLVLTELTEEGNSGLGLLGIARNCSGNFSWEFTETPENELFFSIKINLQ